MFKKNYLFTYMFFYFQIFSHLYFSTNAYDTDVMGGSGVTTDTALDLSTRTDDDYNLDTKKTFVPSPMLMPPPISVPNVKFMPKISPVQSKPPPDSSKLDTCFMFSNNQTGANNTTNMSSVNKKELKVAKKVSFPMDDVKCFITNHTDIDDFTKNSVQYQIHQKIYTTPGNNIRLMPKKCAESFGIQITKAIKSSAGYMKMNKYHFLKKKKYVDDIDVEYLMTPIRCSTPTPSHDGSTILAGHLYYSIDKMSATKEMDAKSEDENDPLAHVLQNIKIKPSKRERKDIPEQQRSSTQEDNEEVSRKHSYCSEWMQQEHGVSTTNSDVPPSLYGSSIHLSESLLDVTSISRNIPPKINSDKHQNKIGMLMNMLANHSNTVFV